MNTTTTAPDLIKDALEDALSVCSSVSMDRNRRVMSLGCPMYLQTEEWCHWAEKEVGPKIEAALAEHLSASPVAAGWQPIETAPKDGRKLLLFYRNQLNKARTVLGRWLTDEEAAETDADDVGLEGGWYECIDNWDDYTEVAIHEGEPTHWQPLPAAPKE